ncbi:MAG: amidohydrolase family protein [Christensenellaceae bacterium]|jgi:predicted TIM-barrel fold metal-dependent hydrolase|nr:amidohydrolase family protein [Christensenellaceae bacterium]
MQYPEGIIDAHTHIFPAAIARRATAAIGTFYDLKMQCLGSTAALLNSGAKIGVKKYLVCSVATRPEQAESINSFIYGECKAHDALIGFATLHPAMECPQAEIERCLKMGMRGIKLHPDFQQFNIDSPRALALYKLIAQYDLPILMHMGDAQKDYSTPARLRRATDAAPDTRFIAAHFGGYLHWREAHDYLKRGNLFFDTSSSLPFLSKEEACGLIEYFGADRFLFGTDFPIWNHEDELARFLALGLPPDAQAAILHGNFEKLFNL